MPPRVKQDRSRRSGHLHSQNIQDMTPPERTYDIDVRVAEWNIRNAYGTLAGDLQRAGDKLTPKMRGQLAVVVANLREMVK